MKNGRLQNESKTHAQNTINIFDDLDVKVSEDEESHLKMKEGRIDIQAYKKEKFVLYMNDTPIVEEPDIYLIPSNISWKSFLKFAIEVQKANGLLDYVCPICETFNQGNSIACSKCGSIYGEDRFPWKKFSNLECCSQSTMTMMSQKEPYSISSIIHIEFHPSFEVMRTENFMLLGERKWKKVDMEAKQAFERVDEEDENCAQSSLREHAFRREKEDGQVEFSSWIELRK